MRNRLQAQSQGKSVYRPVVDGEGDRAGGPGSRHPRRGRQGQPARGRIRRDGTDVVRALGAFDRAGGCHHHLALGAEAPDEDHRPRRPAGSLEIAQAVDPRYLDHQRGPGPRGDREREETLTTSFNSRLNLVRVRFSRHSQKCLKVPLLWLFKVLLNDRKLCLSYTIIDEILINYYRVED